MTVDLLAPRFVMVGDDSRQTLRDEQLYLIADDLVEKVERIQFQIGPSHGEAGDGVTVTVADLRLVLAQFGLRLEEA